MTTATAVKTKIETVTPAKAEKWLETNEGNRRLDVRIRNAYAADILAGKWAMNGESLKFDIDGKLIDGQHRLAACIAAGKSFKSIVVRGLERSAQLNMDTGKLRNFADTLQIGHGVANPGEVATTARSSFLFQTNDGLIANEVTGATSRPPTRTELEDWFVEHADTLEAAGSKSCLVKRGVAGIAPTSLAPVLFTAYHFDLHEQWATFEEALRFGGDKHDPAVQLREFVIRSKMNSHKTRVSPRHVTALSVRAWNRHVEGREVRQLKVTGEEAGSHWGVKGPGGDVLFPFGRSAE